MTIIKADKAGFCFGVKRAVDMAFEASENISSIASYGQLIHNDQVTSRLKERGVVVTDTLEGLKAETIIIRSHGVEAAVYDKASSKNLRVIDCTCPYVKKVHRIVDKYSKLGYKIVIVGDKTHPEVVGIMGWCDEPLVISTAREALELPKNKYCFVAQTTLNQNLWHEIETLFTGKKNIIFFNTICLATKERQDAATELSKQVDCMVVIGGYHSSNTKKLYEICKKYCENTYHIEKKSDLVMTNIKNCVMIGITAGASTPNWIIDEVYDQLVQWHEDV